jgi:hypothetical protein
MNSSRDPLDAILQDAAQQQQARQMQAAVLQAAAQNPHTIERIEQSAIGMAREDDTGRYVLLVATPDGKRRDVKLSPESLRLLRREIAEDEAQAA